MGFVAYLGTLGLQCISAFEPCAHVLCDLVYPGQRQGGSGRSATASREHPDFRCAGSGWKRLQVFVLALGGWQCRFVLGVLYRASTLEWRMWTSGVVCTVAVLIVGLRSAFSELLCVLISARISERVEFCR